MDIKEFAFCRAKEEKEVELSRDVHLCCDSCGDHHIRPRCNLLTGHVFDMAQTYVCLVCKGSMREVHADN
jgi:hypothetical protein